ncbi:efflux RND transporter periplasmic adaptor subunit [Novipirellula artificiosorum]|uniref:Putative efflux pump membrane fusion protein n=1 Tax=Novipirellula artificiosorum TaxID=2528016 RepID=A0A5C6DWA9_9BACT|nr:HlyD family efflux transporter periplasmic adaptor subunit [Novipirellula artificiosorum]TWU40635.1 putative efflux pump membrane fusion protein [Novipirellula artificiosorum]
MNRSGRIASAGLMLLVVGCAPEPTVYPPKPPRPVTTLLLRKAVPDSQNIVSGSVKSWKTESMGFEVSGRIDWVLEPGRNVFGLVEDVNGRVISQGTQLAQIDPDRYEVAVESANAALEVAQLEHEVAQIRKEESIPFDIKSAESDLDLAKDDFARAKKLQAQNAISEAEFDAAENRLGNAQDRIQSLESLLKQSDVEVKSALAKIKKAKQTLRDAERDLKHTTLYAAYRGQISAVDVVPGSVVASGSPVLTLQMMDPIKVEIEVSNEQSRYLQRRQEVPVSFVTGDGQPRETRALVYVVDPSANPATRTFTVTLLILNDQARPEIPASVSGTHVARTQDVWPLDIRSIIGADQQVLGDAPEDAFFVDEDAIETNPDGSFVWLMTDVQRGQPIPEVVAVTKRPVELLDLRIPYLGNWVFRQVRFVDNPPPPLGLLAGRLEFPEGDREQWDGKSLIFDSGPQWMLRPGDLVRVNLSSQSPEAGYFVPVEAIYEESGETFLFVVKQKDGQTVARKTAVKKVNADDLDNGSKMQILPSPSNDIGDGTQIVVGGVHFLQDGDRIAVQPGESP